VTITITLIIGSTTYPNLVRKVFIERRVRIVVVAILKVIANFTLCEYADWIFGVSVVCHAALQPLP